MKRFYNYGKIGAFYGSRSGALAGVLFWLYAMIDTLVSWPQDGTVNWFLGGAFSILLFLVPGGYLLGFIGGFVFGLFGSFARSPLGWSVSGIAGGFVSSWLCVWTLWLIVRSPKIAQFSEFWINTLPVSLFPCVVLGLIGWILGFAMRRGQWRIPRRHLIEK